MKERLASSGLLCPGAASLALYRTPAIAPRFKRDWLPTSCIPSNTLAGLYKQHAASWAVPQKADVEFSSDLVILLLGIQQGEDRKAIIAQ